MSQETFDWLLLLGRWLHITTGITWIGTSIFFMWLDRTFEKNKNSKNPGHVGELWMVHGGGFYQVEKMLMGSVQVPEHLHWFKWESYWTWMSGIFLLLMMFYTGSGTFLLDSSVSNINYLQAVMIGVSSVVISWFIYDLLWESKLTKTNPLVGHGLTILWFAGVTYFLCHTLSGRAAFIHIGAMLGTWMTANVFLRIIPRQVKMVEAAKKGEPVNQEWGKNAKNRSTHNTYLTLPVIFIMTSNHFPFTYGHEYNWLILLIISLAGASLREYFVARVQKPSRAKIFGGVSLVLFLILIFSNRPWGSSFKSNESSEKGPSQNSGGVQNPKVISPLGTASIKGVVRFEGAVPEREKLSLPPGCNSSQKTETLSNNILIKDGKIRNTLVQITKGIEGKFFGEAPAEIAKLDQKDCLYVPRVLAVQTGQRVEILNSDEVFHNVRSITKANDTFNLMMPKKDDRAYKIFDKPELFLQTKCDVHPWMNAYVAVIDHPFFSVTNEDGEFNISKVPTGSYTLEVWHEVFGTQTKQIEIRDGENLQLEFIFKK